MRYIFFFLFFFPISLFAQHDTYLYHLVHKTYSIENNLPQNSIYDITQDNDGFLWIATAEGLARFDGHSFITFGSWNTEALKSSHVSALLRTDEGDLLIGLKRGGIVSKSPEDVFTHISATEAMSISSMSQYGDVIVAGTYGNGLYRIENNDVLPIEPADAGNMLSSIYDCEVVTDGTIWVATDNGVFLISEDGELKKRYTTDSGLSGNLVRTIYRDSKDRMWLGTSKNGITRIDGDIFTVFSKKDGLLSEKVFSIAEDAWNNLMVGTANGLNMINEEDSILTFSGPEKISSQYIRTLYGDRGGNLWVGTFGNGLHLFREGHFTTFTTSDGLSSDRIFSIEQTKDKTIWAGTYLSGLNYRKDGVFYPFDLSPDKSFGVTALYSDGEFLRVGTYAEGIFSINISDRSVRTHKSFPENQQIVSVIYRDAEDTLWTGGYNPPIMKFDGESFKALSNEFPLGDETVIRDIFEKEKGFLWFVAEHSGIVEYEKDNGFSYLPAWKNLEKKVAFTDVFKDSKGNIWLGSNENGLAFYDSQKKKFIFITKKDGLSSNIVHKITEDNQKTLWLTTNTGISNISIENLENFIKNPSEKLSVRFFSKSEGIKNPEFVGGLQSSSMKAEDGTLWFATIGGIAFHDPEHSLPHSTPPDVILEKISVERKKFSFNDDIVLDPYDRNLSISFTAPFFSSPDDISFFYKLEGFDRDWHKADFSRTARYSSLPAGEYTFSVKAFISSLNISIPPTTVSITKKPRFYESFWFFIILFAGSFSVGFIVYKIRMRGIVNINKELNEIINIKDEELREVEDELQQKYSSSSLDSKVVNEYKKRILEFMEKEKPYLDEELSIRKLADMLEIKPHHLSQVINSEFDKNFYTFVNRYRVDTVKRMLLDPENKHITILAVAYDCGFKSKSSFNTVFKRFTGMTPSQFRKQEEEKNES
ncbi:MAG: two-component regulator propeller domain-containing protein [bacterium]